MSVTAVNDIGPAEKKRWHIVSILIAQQIINTTQWISLAPVAVEVGQLYGVDIQLVNTLSAICLLLFPPGMVLCSYLVRVTDLRTTMLVAAALNLLSGIFRVASFPVIDILGGDVAYGVIFLGQVIGAFAQPMCTNIPVRVASDWFAQEQRDFATGFSNIGFGLGQLVAMSLPGILVAKGSSDGVGQMLLLELFMALAAFIWCYACFENEPKMPPSRAAAEKRRMRQEQREAGTDQGESLKSVLNDYKSLLKEPNFCFMLVAFSLGLGGFNCLFTDMEQLLQPAGYSSSDASIIGVCFILGGAVFGPLSALLLDRTHAYNSMLKICFCCTLAFGINFTLQIRPDNNMIICASAAGFGAASVPILPIALAVTTEVTYPLPEEASTGLLILGGNYFGVFFTYYFAELLEKSTTFTGVFTPAAYAMIAILTVACLFALLFNGTYKRQMAENSKTVPLLA
jgi:sugar phosphate permease